MAPAAGKVGFDEGWALEQRLALFEAATQLVRDHARPGPQRADWRAIVHTLRPGTGSAPSVGRAMDLLPILTCVGSGGQAERAVPLAAMLALLWRGVGVLDDIADHDPPSPAGRILAPELAAYELICGLPPAVIPRLGVSCSVGFEILRALGRGLVRASAGQRMDLALRESSAPTARAVEACAAAKAGELVAVATASGALAGGADARVVRAYTRAGRALGVAFSLAEDYLDVFCSDWSRDLSNGTRSFPIASYLERQHGGDRIAFLTLLAAAQHEPQAQVVVRTTLRDAGEVQRCALRIACYAVRARRGLAAASVREPARDALLAMIGRLPLMRRLPS